jgi:hypothetical protein
MRLATTVILATALAVGACASPPRDRGQGGRNAGPGVNPSRSGGIVTPAGLVLASFDMDHDAVVTSSEVQDGAERVFVASDQDANGVLSGIEITGFSQRHLGMAYGVPGRIAFDPDGDSVSTLDEFTAVWISELVRHDRNADGQVSREELIRQVSLGQQGQGRPSGGRGGRGGPGGGGRGPGGPG